MYAVRRKRISKSEILLCKDFVGSYHLSMETEEGFCPDGQNHAIFFHTVLCTAASSYGAGRCKQKKILLPGGVMVSTGVLKVGIAIRGPVNRVIKLEPFLKRNDKNNFALAA